MAAKLKLTPELHEQFVKLAGKMCPLTVACKIVRITFETFTTWRDRAILGEEPYKSFIEDVEAAKANAIQRDIDLWDEANQRDKDPRWIAKRLEVLVDVQANPVKKEIEITGGVQIGPAFNTALLTDGEFSDWCKLVDKMNPTKRVESTESLLIEPRTIDV